MSPAGHSDANPALDGFFDTLFRHRPVDATFIGQHDQDHRLPDWSPAGLDAATAAWSWQHDALRGALAGATDDHVLRSGDWGRIDLALAASHCELSLAELEGPHMHRGNPSLAIGEAAFGVIALITRDFLPPEQRASWLLQRLRQVPAFLAGALATLRQQPVPGAWREKALKEARATARLLDDGLPLWSQAMGLASGIGATLHDASQLALGGVHAFASALDALPAAQSEVAACGEALLDVCIRRGHWIDRSADDLRADIQRRFADERSRLDAMVRNCGARDLGEVLARLAARHPAPDEYYGAFGRVRDACQACAATHDLVTWPDAPIGYVPIPRWTRMAAGDLYYLFYRSPAPLDPWAPYEYVVSPIDDLDADAQERLLRSWNDSVIKLNHVVHHGALGHHVQNWYAARAPSRVGRVAAADCASRIAMLLGGTMAEGWACYATDLMDEAGFLTPDERVAEQQTRVRMLARALNDLEFHSGRRTWSESVRFYVDDAGMSAEAARNEAVKNSMFPGTAMMYWLGTQGIHDLRAAVRVREGAAFSLRRFHDRLLSHGAIPVAVTTRLMLQGGADDARK